MNEIKAYIHCRNCIQAHKEDHLAIGLTNSQTLRVWCESCDKLVGDFQISKPMKLRCDVCGEIIDREHKH